MAHTHCPSTTTREDRQPTQHPAFPSPTTGGGTASSQSALVAPLVTTNKSTPSERAHKSWARTTDRAARMAPALRARRYQAAERYINELVESAPPLTDEQRSRLAALLRPTGGAL